MMESVVSTAKPFVPVRIKADEQGFYVVSLHLQPNLGTSLLGEVSVAPNGYDDGWVTMKFGDIYPNHDDNSEKECLLNELFLLLRGYGSWVGVSKDHFFKVVSRKPMSMLRSCLERIDAILTFLSTEGWVELINKADGEPVIYVTAKLLRLIAPSR
jgi:hypothetical protein